MTMGRRYANRSDSYAGDSYIVCDIIVKDVCDASLQHSIHTGRDWEAEKTQQYCLQNHPRSQQRAEMRAKYCLAKKSGDGYLFSKSVNTFPTTEKDFENSRGVENIRWKRYNADETVCRASLAKRLTQRVQ